jgi:hypothetical protein
MSAADLSSLGLAQLGADYVSATGTFTSGTSPVQVFGTDPTRVLIAAWSNSGTGTVQFAPFAYTPPPPGIVLPGTGVLLIRWQDWGPLVGQAWYGFDAGGGTGGRWMTLSYRPQR